MFKSAIRSLTILLISLFMLSGCWLPENFEVNIKVFKDGSASFSYDGTLVYALALSAVKEGTLTDKDEAQFAKEAEKLKKEPGFKDVDYQGEGRYKVLVENDIQAGKKYYFLSKDIDIFSIRTQKDGTLKIKAAQFESSDIDELESVGAEINGILNVYIEEGADVIEHNAPEGPDSDGDFARYTWEIESFEAEPVIIVKPEK